MRPTVVADRSSCFSRGALAHLGVVTVVIGAGPNAGPAAQQAQTVAQIRRLGPGQPRVRVHQNQLVTQVPQHQMVGQSPTDLSNTENGYFLRGHVSLSSIY